MSRQTSTPVALTLIALTLFAGCHPIEPFFLHEDGDLSHYLEQETDLEYPDVATATLPGVAHCEAPITLTNFEEPDYWELPIFIPTPSCSCQLVYCPTRGVPETPLLFSSLSLLQAQWFLAWRPPFYGRLSDGHWSDWELPCFLYRL